MTAYRNRIITKPLQTSFPKIRVLTPKIGTAHYGQSSSVHWLLLAVYRDIYKFYI